MDNENTAVPPQQAWSASDVLRLALEDGDFLGFIEVNDSIKTLAHVRQKINEELDHVPKKFNFLLPDGVPVSLRQEKSIAATDFLPHLTIRRGGNAPGMSNKVSVNFNGESLSSWITPQYTFGQLRRDAARYFNLPTNDCLLQDDEGCAWPEHAKIEAMFSEDARDRPGIHIILKTAHSMTRAFGNNNSSSNNNNNNINGTQGNKIMSSMQNNSGVSQQQPQQPPMERLINAAASDVDIESELWRIFTFYCVHGDAKEVEHLRCHHWLQLMRDVELLGSGTASRTPAASFRVIYSAESRGQTGSSGKMNYDEFLNALMNVSSRACTPRDNQWQTGPSQEALEAAFCELLVEYMLPYGRRWSVNVWEEQSKLLLLDEVVETARLFKGPLYDIFRFYSPASELDPKALREFGLCLGYKDWMTFVQDFDLKNDLALSLQQIGEVFLASCHNNSEVLLSRIGGHPDDSIRQRRHRQLLHSSATGRDAFGNPLALTMSSNDGETTRINPSLFQNSSRRKARNRLYFGNFLDAILRTSLFAFDGMEDENGPLRPANMVKALFQQLSRTLSRSRITKILAKRRITCSYPAGLMRGSMNLNAKYLAMWKRDDCCDYLHSERSEGEVINSTMGQFIQHQKKKTRGRRTTMRDFSSPNTTLRPQGSNNARFSPSSQHTSPQGGAAAFSLLQSPLSTNQQHFNRKNQDKTGRGLLSRLLTLNSNTLALGNGGEQQVNDANVEILTSPQAVMPTTSPASIGLPNNNNSNNSNNTDGGIALLSPASMGGFGDSRTSAFQPNLLRAGRSNKSINYQSSNSLNSSMNNMNITSKNKGYDYGKLFERRNERLSNEQIQKSKSVMHMAPTSPGHRMRGLKGKAQSSPTINNNTNKNSQGGSPKNVINQMQAVREQQQQQQSMSNGTSDNGQNNNSGITGQSITNRSLSNASNASTNSSQSNMNSPSVRKNANRINEMYPDFSVDEAQTFLQMYNNNLQQCLNMIMEKSVSYIRKHIQEAHARAVVKSMVNNDSNSPNGTNSPNNRHRIEEEQRIRDQRMRRALKKGFLCYKHATTSKRQRRFIYVTSDFKHFAWRALARGSKETKRFAVKDIQGMANGASFADDRLTVTLRLVTRQVNLEFEDQSTRDAFVEAFTWLLKNSRAGTLM